MNASSPSRSSSTAIAPERAPDDVPTTTATRDQRGLSWRRFRKPSSMSTPLMPPPESTTATSLLPAMATG